MRLKAQRSFSASPITGRASLSCLHTAPNDRSGADMHGGSPRLFCQSQQTPQNQTSIEIKAG